MKSLNKTETPIFLSVVCFFVSKGNLFDVYFIFGLHLPYGKTFQ